MEGSRSARSTGSSTSATARSPGRSRSPAVRRQWQLQWPRRMPWRGLDNVRRVAADPPASALISLDHEELVIRKGRRSGVYTIVAVHSTTLGPALGGCRMWRYASSADGARDALRLSRAMTFKAAAAGLDLGGGKAVISLPPGPPPSGKARRAILEDFGDTVAILE